jgi:hypothetical protein
VLHELQKCETVEMRFAGTAPSRRPVRQVDFASRVRMRIDARITMTREVADELWRMAKEYQAQAAEMGDFPEIGDEPPLGSRPRP